MEETVAEWTYGDRIKLTGRTKTTVDRTLSERGTKLRQHISNTGTLSFRFRFLTLPPSLDTCHPHILISSYPGGRKAPHRVGYSVHEPTPSHAPNHVNFCLAECVYQCTIRKVPGALNTSFPTFSTSACALKNELRELSTFHR